MLWADTNKCIVQFWYCTVQGHWMNLTLRFQGFLCLIDAFQHYTDYLYTI